MSLFYIFFIKIHPHTSIYRYSGGYFIYYPIILSILLLYYSIIYSCYCYSLCQIENNTPCVYAIGFKRSPMLEYIYNGHSIAYDRSNFHGCFFIFWVIHTHTQRSECIVYSKSIKYYFSIIFCIVISSFHHYQKRSEFRLLGRTSHKNGGTICN